MNNGLSFRWFGEEETIPFVTSLAIDPKTPSTIYAGTSQEGLYKSADGARNWERINAQGFDFISVNLGNPRILYGIFSGVLILRSMDGGKNWERFDKGLPGEPPGSRCLAIDPKNPRKVYVGTYRGLYSIIQTDISVITAVSPNGKMFTEWGCLKQDALFQNYPNPFNPETWISYQLAEDDFVTIEIYDTFGNLIHTIPLGIQKAGFYLTKDEAAHWDGRNKQGEFVASGIYFITLKTSRFTDTRKAAMKK
jgi:hypothetical protein